MINWKNGEIFQKNSKQRDSFQLQKIGLNSLKYSSLKRHQSKIETNIKQVKIKKPLSPIEKKETKNIDNLNKSPLAPRLKPNHKDVLTSKAKIVDSKLNQEKNPKKILPLEIKRQKCIKKSSILDSFSTFKSFSNTNLNAFIKKGKKTDANKISELISRSVYNSNTVMPKVQIKSEEKELTPIGKAKKKNLNKYFDRIIKHFGLENIDSGSDRVNLFDLYLD